MCFFIFFYFIIIIFFFEGLYLTKILSSILFARMRQCLLTLDTIYTWFIQIYARKY